MKARSGTLPLVILALSMLVVYPHNGPASGSPPAMDDVTTTLMSFGTGTDVGAPAATVRAVVEGDLDHDGDRDLVVGLESGVIAIYVNDGTPLSGLWPEAKVGNCGDAVYALALGDLDHDGQPDLVCGCGDGAAYQVVAWRNDGSPLNNEWVANGLGGAGDTYAVALGDLDNDGWLDVVSGAQTAVIDAWQNDGTPFSGLWSVRQIVGNTTEPTTALAVGDLDHDGYVDVVSGDAHDRIIAWRNDRSPYVDPWASTMVGDSKDDLHTVALADLNGDGAPEIVSDVAYPDLGDTAVGAWQQSGAPFGAPWSLTVIGRTKDTVLSLAVADLDRDGKPDIVSGSAAGAEREVIAWGSPAAPFADPWVMEEVGPSSDSVYAVTLSDVDGDGDPDIVTGSGAAEDFEVIAWENKDEPSALGNWVEVTQPLPAYNALAVDAADFDHDGQRDLAAGTVGKGLLVWRGDGGYTWDRLGLTELPDAGTFTDVAWGQLNNRNELDLAAATKGAGLGAWVAWELGTVWDDVSAGLPTTGDYEAVALGHIDYDGVLDLAACGVGVGVRTWRNDGGWTLKSVVSDTLTFCDVALGDLNHDGHLDLVAANCGDNAGIIAWPGDGGHGYLAPAPVVATGWYAALALGDINRDGNLDVAAAAGSGIDVWLGDGAGGWTPGAGAGPSLSALSLDLGDFDSDGYLDLLAGHKSGITLWRGDGGASWTDANLNLPTTGVYRGVTFGRIDGDAALDVIGAEDGAGAVRIWTAVEPPPGGWTDFQPPTDPPWWWITDQTPTCTVQVADAGSGLDVSTSEYRFSRDGGATWEGGWLPAAVTGADGTTDPQVMTAADVAFNQDSVDQNVIQFRITDLEGYTGTSPLYTVAIDATPPTNPTTLSSSTHTVREWNSTAGVTAAWNAGADSTSGPWAYSYELTTSATSVPDEDMETPSLYGTDYANADGMNWYFHVRVQDYAGNWAVGATHAGPYYIDLTNPTAPSSVWSTSHTTSVWNDDSTINAAWTAANDSSSSGILGYWYSWTHGPQDNPTAYNTTLRTATSPSLSSNNDWYFNVQARDLVGHRPETVHLGPFYIDTIDPYADVNPPYPSTPTADFTVSWSSWESASPPPQSGVASVDLAYRDVTMDGPWIIWLLGQAPVSSTTFHGADGHTYEFRARATDHAGNTGPWCTAARTVVASLDFAPFALEVTQAVQDLNNSVVLVSDKRTYVRLHVRSLVHGDEGPVGAVLRGWRDGAYLGALPPNNPGGTMTVRGDPDRAVLGQSFYFDIPTSWLHGTVAFIGEVNPAETLAESNYDNNEHREDVTFHDTPTMHLMIVDACYKTGGTTYHVRDFDRIALASWLRRAYPIDNLDVQWGTRSPCYTYVPAAWEVNVSLDWCHFWEWMGGDAGWYDRWYGMIDDRGDFVRGLGQRPGNVASGPSGSGDWGWDYDGSYADWYGGHELGHTYNRRHTRGTQPPECPSECCGSEADNRVVYPNGDISPTRDESDADALYGFDVGTLAVYPPSSKDVMTYCDDIWLSDDTYEGIRSRMVSESGLAATSADVAQVGEHLVVFGAVISPTDELHLETFYRMDDVWDVFGRVPGEYSIRLLDAGGATLADYAFTPGFEHLDAQGACGAGVQAADEVISMIGTISEAVPWVAGTARVAILHGTEEIGSRAVTAHAPVVTLTSPNGGESFTGATIPVSWTASDADGDALVFTLGYSTDGGTNWQVLASDVTGTSLTLDANLVQGTDQGKVRIVASDGVNTGQDETEGVFSVSNKAPKVWITSPGALAAYVYGQSVGLSADALDVEDGTLTGASLTWTSNLSGTVGTGALLHVTDLITGVHTLTVTATDGDGMTATDAVKIYVGVTPARIYLPLTLKSH